MSRIFATGDWTAWAQYTKVLEDFVGPTDEDIRVQALSVAEIAGWDTAHVNYNRYLQFRLSDRLGRWAVVQAEKFIAERVAVAIRVPQHVADHVIVQVRKRGPDRVAGRLHENALGMIRDKVPHVVVDYSQVRHRQLVAVEVDVVVPDRYVLADLAPAG